MRNIVLEGPDNAGKSTLAQKLSEALELPIRHSGGPSKYPGEVNERAQSFIADDTQYIYDRHPCVSQNVYVAALNNGGELVTEENIQQFYASDPIVIYCRSKGSLEGHEQSEHSSVEYFNEVEKAYPTLCKLYDAWAEEKTPEIVYTIGNDVEIIITHLKGLLK